jgi:hypothetical protein
MLDFLYQSDIMLVNKKKDQLVFKNKINLKTVRGGT